MLSGLGANLPAWDKIKLTRRAEACKWTVVLQFGKSYESVFVEIWPLKKFALIERAMEPFWHMGLHNHHDTCGQIAREERACWLGYLWVYRLGPKIKAESCQMWLWKSWQSFQELNEKLNFANPKGWNSGFWLDAVQNHDSHWNYENWKFLFFKTLTKTFSCLQKSKLIQSQASKWPKRAHLCI